MGQGWLVVNLDKHEVLSEYAAKLGEDLPTGAYSKLANLLARPVGGRTMDRKDLDEKVEEMKDRGSSPPRSKRNNSSPHNRLTDKTGSRLVSHGAMQKLPKEVLGMIFAGFDEYEDIMRLSLTNTTLFLIGYKCIQKRYMHEIPSWAGDRLICLGEYTDAEDLPEGVFNEEETTGIKQLFVEPDDEDEEEPTCVWDYFRQNGGEFKKAKQFTGAGKDSFKFLRRDLKLKDHGMLEYQLFYYLNKPRPDYSENGTWVLCNLSKREYVDTGAISTLTDKNPRGPFFEGRMTLGEVLVSRICWSTDASTSLVYEGDIHRGAWAGDRFEITTVEKLKPNQAGSQWKNVSDEIVKEMEAIWQGEYGDDWRKRA
ncbi:unnamed protein product [Somion occarium]|uniref:F-box domain-containing protein n=2 Tax=Somion occarium TaxID=3059160 RepID=A0ABP1CMG9_9APHY